ncbi:MAG: Uncharacterised protein [Cyanobium sp. ARS6]|nr:MAG: Uncharacterised protein [Cyanobium sp. ARS6]
MWWHGVNQPSNLADNRHTAVTHGIELADAAGFKTTGHQEGITAGVDQA